MVAIFLLCDCGMVAGVVAAGLLCGCGMGAVWLRCKKSKVYYLGGTGTGDLPVLNPKR